MNYWPDAETFFKKAAEGNLIPVFRELPADLETPVSVFLKLCHTAPSFLLESVEGGEQLGRYSFIGTNPFLTLQASASEALIRQKGGVQRIALSPGPGGADPLHVIKELMSQYQVVRMPGLPRFFGGAVGYLAYDTARYFERLPTPKRDELGLPEAIFLFTDTLVIFDHVQRRMKVVSNAIIDNDPILTYGEARERIEGIISALAQPIPNSTLTHSPAGDPLRELVSNVTQGEFEAMVAAAKDYIAAGDAFQIVLSQRLRRTTTASPFAIYRALRMLNPSPYMFYLDLGSFQLIGSSPEMLVKLENRRAETRPIAGTRPRGASEEEDEALAAELLDDPKERAEHVMLVDLGRNDLGRVCRYGWVRVPSFMTIERYSHVMHIVSSVEGELDDHKDAFNLFRACFPAGTVSGAPKIRAMEIISELEGLRRGPYAGAVGYFSFTGNMDTCITIRTIVMVGDTVYLQAGAGIVADSHPSREYEESLSKIRALERAVGIAEGG